MKENKKEVLADDNEIKCVADFLNILKNDLEELNSNKERFFRGLSKTKYIETDYPSIFRSPDHNPEYEPYIKYEHEMFYDLVSRFPEQFSSCKNTFEHLVMMQHYGFPTRLLDVTSNPLVALYFACVDRNGNINDDLDGAVTIYDIPKKQIKNYNSDTVTILSNLARVSQEYQPYYSYFNDFMKQIRRLANDVQIQYINLNFIEIVLKKMEKVMEIHQSIKMNLGVFHGKIDFIKSEKNKIFKKIEEYKNCTDDANKKTFLKKLKEHINKFSKWFLGAYDFYPHLVDLKFKHLIQEEKNYFIFENIVPTDLTSFFCVKPKLNNPRLIRQSGAFLLFGFMDTKSTKEIPPEVHLKKRIKISSDKDGIIIKKDNKVEIYKELKQLGIHRAFLFPEIDNVSQIVASNYKKQK